MSDSRSINRQIWYFLRTPEDNVIIPEFVVKMSEYRENKVKIFNIVIILFVITAGALAFADSSETRAELSSREKAMDMACNREARNALAANDTTVVEKICTDAISVIGKNHPDTEALVNPLMNLAFSYTLASKFSKASPLYERARAIRAKQFGPDSSQVKEIDNMITSQDELARHRARHKND